MGLSGATFSTERYKMTGLGHFWASSFDETLFFVDVFS